MGPLRFNGLTERENHRSLMQSRDLILALNIDPVVLKQEFFIFCAQCVIFTIDLVNVIQRLVALQLIQDEV